MHEPRNSNYECVTGAPMERKIRNPPGDTVRVLRSERDGKRMKRREGLERFWSFGENANSSFFLGEKIAQFYEVSSV